MAAAVPVVATDVPACREVLSNGELGALVAAGDPAGLSAGIRGESREMWSGSVCGRRLD